MSDDASSSNFAPLPLLLYAKPSARLELFAKKMRFCCQQCNFSDPGADLKKKELKRIYLNECVEFVKERRGILIEPIYAMTFALFAHNVFRNLPPHTRLYDPDEDEMIPCPSWPHLQLVYAFFIRVLESPDFQPSKAKRFLDHNFVAKLIDMFASDDDNERDSLKTTLHRIYAKFLGLRSFIRKEINNKCLELIYENLYFPGITEILEVLGSVINGFACPIKPEHIQFLNQILLPLHSLPKLQHFHAQLVYCVVQYFEKDSSLAEEFIKKFLKRWPKTASAKEVLFLDELEELIDIIQPAEFSKVQRIIFMQVAKCIRSEQSQIIANVIAMAAVIRNRVTLSQNFVYIYVLNTLFANALFGLVSLYKVFNDVLALERKWNSEEPFRWDAKEDTVVMNWWAFRDGHVTTLFIAMSGSICALSYGIRESSYFVGRVARQTFINNRTSSRSGAKTFVALLLTWIFPCSLNIANAAGWNCAKNCVCVPVYYGPENSACYSELHRDCSRLLQTQKQAMLFIVVAVWLLESIVIVFMNITTVRRYISVTTSESSKFRVESPRNSSSGSDRRGSFENVQYNRDHREEKQLEKNAANPDKVDGVNTDQSLGPKVKSSDSSFGNESSNIRNISSTDSGCCLFSTNWSRLSLLNHNIKLLLILSISFILCTVPSAVTILVDAFSTKPVFTFITATIPTVFCLFYSFICPLVMIGYMAGLRGAVNRMLFRCSCCTKTTVSNSFRGK